MLETRAGGLLFSNLNLIYDNFSHVYIFKVIFLNLLTCGQSVVWAYYYPVNYAIIWIINCCRFDSSFIQQMKWELFAYVCDVF